MPYFVLIFDRRKGRLEQFEKVEDAALDFARASLRWHQERLMGDLENWDIILFESPSYDVLRRTHSVFFPPPAA